MLRDYVYGRVCLSVCLSVCNALTLVQTFGTKAEIVIENNYRLYFMLLLKTARISPTVATARDCYSL